MPCLGAGVLGFVVFIFTSNIGIDGGHTIEGGTAGYKLTVRVLGAVLHEDTSPAVDRTDSRIGKFIGPSSALDLKMQLWGLGIGLAYVILASVIGAFLGTAMCRLTNKALTSRVRRESGE